MLFTCNETENVRQATRAGHVRVPYLGEFPALERPRPSAAGRPHDAEVSARDVSNNFGHFDVSDILHSMHAPPKIASQAQKIASPK